MVKSIMNFGKVNITFVTSVFNPPSLVQKNALYSWKRAKIPFIIVGSSSESHIKEYKKESDLGFPGDSPLVNGMIRKSLPLIKTDMVGLVNADVLIEEDFSIVLDKFIRKYGTDIFLTSIRRDTNWNGPISNDADLKKVLRTSWNSHQDASSDLFISSKERFEKFSREFPDFILGRLAWDNAVHTYFLKQGIPCINSSKYLKIYHQKHGYSHFINEDFKTIQRNPGLHPSTSHNCHLFGAFRHKMKMPIPRISTDFLQLDI